MNLELAQSMGLVLSFGRANKEEKKKEYWSIIMLNGLFYKIYSYEFAYLHRHPFVKTCAQISHVNVMQDPNDIFLEKTTIHDKWWTYILENDLPWLLEDILVIERL